MPNFLDAFGGSNGYPVNKNPNNRLRVDPTKYLVPIPTAAELEAQIIPIDATLGITQLLTAIDQVTGLNFLGMQTSLQSLLGTNTNLASGFTNQWQAFLTGVNGGNNTSVGTLVNNVVAGIGTIDPARITHVPLSAIGNGIGSTTGQTTNLITNGAFNTSSSIANVTGWVWDGAVDHSGVSGSGSARTTADGTTKALMTNPISVSLNQALSISAYAQWSGLVRTGNPISLNVQQFLNTQPVGAPILVQAIPSPGTNGSWTLLSGTYTAPSGVDAIRVLTMVGPSATAGSVWFDDVTAMKTGLLQPTWMNGFLTTIYADLVNQYQHFNDVVGQLLGVPITSQQLPVDAANALQNTTNTIVSLSSKVQEFATTQSGATQTGMGFNVNFSNYPSGAWAQAPFNTTYTGAGTGHLTLNNGQAQWIRVTDGDVSALAIFLTGISVTITGGSPFTLTYNGVTTSSIANGASAATVQAALQALANMPATNVTVTGAGTGGNPYILAFNAFGTLTGSVNTTIAALSGNTATDYQQLQATLGGLPNGAGSKNYACVRMSNDMLNYVYGVVYLSAGWTLNWEVGCYKSGVKHAFAAGSNAPLNLSFTLLAGVAGNPYRLQGIAGDVVVFDYTDNGQDPGGTLGTPTSHLGSAYRGWGFRSDTASGGQATPAPASYVGCSDNSPPAVPGSGFRMYCTSSTAITNSIATGYNSITSGFLDTVSGTVGPGYVPLVGPSSEQRLQVPGAGRYYCNFRCDMQMAASLGMVTISPAVKRFNSSGSLQETRLLSGLGVAFNIAGAQDYTSFFGGSDVIDCGAGDILELGYWIDGLGTTSSLKLLGEASGGHTYWTVALENWSLN